MLSAKAQIVLFWGPEFIALYNDAYAPTIGDKSWLGKFGQRDKWSFCLTAARMAAEQERR